MASSFLWTSLHPLRDFFFAPGPLSYRWRLLLLQPIVLMTYMLKTLPYFFSRPFVVRSIPTRRLGESLRALVYNHPMKCSRSLKNVKKRPLHIDIHGGAFIGGTPEYNAPFCDQLARKTGAVVVSITYRFAPRYTFPAAHDDVDDIFVWLLEHADEEFGADTTLLTVSGFSAGANLALAGSLKVKNESGRSGVLGAVTFYAPVDLRLPPENKRKPQNYPKNNMFWFLAPLFDAYAGPKRIRYMEDARMNPTLASVQDLPKEMLFVIPTVDILLDEQLEMIDRLQQEIEATQQGAERGVKKAIFEGQWHGWDQLPSAVIDVSTREKAYETACHFIREVHQRHGFILEET